VGFVLQPRVADTEIDLELDRCHATITVAVGPRMISPNGPGCLLG
jgi:hypothetical protein